jgi:hypothetical protein
MDLLWCVGDEGQTLSPLVNQRSYCDATPALRPGAGRGR